MYRNSLSSRPSLASRIVFAIFACVGLFGSANAATYVVKAVEDSFVSFKTPTTPRGDVERLASTGEYDYRKRAYIKFDLTGLPAGAVITNANLKVLSRTNVSANVGVYPGRNSAWSEATLTWNNQPWWNDILLDHVDQHKADHWSTFDVSAAISRPDMYSFVLSIPSGQTPRARFYSKENGGDRGPRLEIEYTLSAQTNYGVSLRIYTEDEYLGQPVEDKTFLPPQEALDLADRNYGRVGMVRVFFPYGVKPTWTAQKVAVPLAAGRDVHISFKESPQAVNLGTHDAYYRNFFATAPEGVKIWWTFYHEPEDNIEAGEFSAEDYRLAFQRLRNISKEAGVAKSNVKSALVLMDWTAHSGSHRDWHNYYPGSAAIDVFAWDVYGFKEEDADPNNNETMAQHQASRPTLAITRAEGKPYAIAELGYNHPASRSAFFRDLGGWSQDNNVAYISYFDLIGTLGDHRLLDVPSQQAYTEINEK